MIEVRVKVMVVQFMELVMKIMEWEDQNKGPLSITTEL
jgi:hypothetical protein